MTTKDEADDSRVADATSKGLDVSGRETLSNEGASMIEACMIEADKSVRPMRLRR